MREKNIKKPTTSARKKSAWLVSESLESLSMSRFLFEEGDNKTVTSNDDADAPTVFASGPDNGERGTFDNDDPPTQHGEPPTVFSTPPIDDDYTPDMSGPNTSIRDNATQQSTPSATTSSSPGQNGEFSDETVVDASDKTVPSVLQKSFVAVLSALGKITDSREIRGKSLNEQGIGVANPSAENHGVPAQQSPSAKKLHGTVTNIAKYVKTLAADDDEDTEEFYMAAVWLLSFVSLLDQVSTAAKNTPKSDSDKTLEDILGGYGGVKRLVDKNFKPNRQVQDFLMKSESQRRDLETLLAEAGLFSKFVARPIQRWLNSSSPGKKMKAMFEPNGKVMVSVYDAIADMTPDALRNFEDELKGLKTRVAAPMAKFLKDLKSEVPPASTAERPTSSGTGPEAPTAPAGEARQSTSQTPTTPPPERREQPTRPPERPAAGPAAKKLSDVLGLSGDGNKVKREKVLDRLKNVDISVTGIGDDLDDTQKGKLKGEIDKYEKELRDKLGREFTAESQRAKSEESVIIERWQRLAGIIK